MSVELTPIGSLHSPFSQKFGIPRQSAGLTDIPGYITLTPPYDDLNGFRGIDAFSHLWIVFQFHHSIEQTQSYSPLIRPPRLGGNDKMGVFASRSSFRPNNIGLSLVKFVKIERVSGQTRLHISGVDCLSGTPVLDIKPYVAYADSHPNALSGYAKEQPQATLSVTFSPDLQAQTEEMLALITQVISLDPRPAYHQRPEYQALHPDKIYQLRLYDFEIGFIVDNDSQAKVITINQ